MKRIISVFLAVALLGAILSIPFSASAELNWKSEYPTVINNYDNGDLPQGFTMWGAAVAEYGNGNNAVKISEYTTRSYEWPACFRILDSNNENSNFTPIADTKYKISFKYRIDKANSSKPIAIELRYDKPNGNMSMSLDNLMTYGYLKETLVSSAAGAVTDGWVSFEKEVTFSSMPDGANSVYLAVTTGLADWNGKEGAIEVWIDDVELESEKVAEVMCRNYNGTDRMIKITQSEKFSDLTQPHRSGYDFGGWYADKAYTQKISDDELPRNYEEFWVKWTLSSDWKILNSYDEESTLPQDFTKWGAAVVEYESGNNAVKISEYTTRSYNWPACFRILDSNNGNSNFTPIAETKYKISFEYRIDKSNSSKPIAIELRYDKPGGNMSMSLDNLMTYGYLKETLVNSAAGAVTDGWVSFEKEVTFSSMPDGANSVYLAITTGLTDWNGKEGAIEVWIDDVSVIPEVLENHIRGDLNDDKEVNVLDLIKIKKAATGIIEKGMAYDINGDCNVSDAGDIACLRKMILGIDVIHNVNLNGSVYNLVWNDEFNGTVLDSSKWDDTRILMQSDGITQLSGEEAKENGTLKVGDGYLTLATKKSNGNYITTSINTYDAMQFQYGYAEIRAKFPYGVKGAWPSWWMTNAYSTINSGIDASLPYGVEFDIVEVMNGSNKNSPNIHKWYREVKDENNKVVRDAMQLVFSDSGNKISNYTMPNDKVNDFHTYGFLWKENEIIFSIDGEIYNTLDITCKFGEKDTEDSQYINQPMDFIFTNWISNAALSGKTFEGSELVVDYIRLYQNNECKIAK